MDKQKFVYLYIILYKIWRVLLFICAKGVRGDTWERMTVTTPFLCLRSTPESFIPPFLSWFYYGTGTPLKRIFPLPAHPSFNPCEGHLSWQVGEAWWLFRTGARACLSTHFCALGPICFVWALQSIKNIASDFKNCPSLQEIHLKATTPPIYEG